MELLSPKEKQQNLFDQANALNQTMLDAQTPEPKGT